MFWVENLTLFNEKNLKPSQSMFDFPGPSVLEVFNTLLRHLRVSVDYKYSDPQRMNDEKNFQEAVINTIGKNKRKEQ